MLRGVKPNAAERKALLGCGVAGGFLCTVPGELVSAGIVWAITFAGYLVHKRLLAREEAAPAEAGDNAG